MILILRSARHDATHHRVPATQMPPFERRRGTVRFVCRISHARKSQFARDHRLEILSSAAVPRRLFASTGSPIVFVVCLILATSKKLLGLDSLERTNFALRNRTERNEIDSTGNNKTTMVALGDTIFAFDGTQ